MNAKSALRFRSSKGHRDYGRQTNRFRLFRPVFFIFFVVLLLTACVFPLTALAWDGHRKGFVLGGGIGGGWFLDRGRSGITTDFRIGYGLNDQVLIAYSGLLHAEIVFEGEEDAIFLPSIRGTYYLSEHAPSLMVSAGIGPLVARLNDEQDPKTSVAPYLGLGFEFIPHVSFQCDIIYLPFTTDYGDLNDDLLCIVHINILGY